jgi:ectoine hydroxylase-related dioxygenase (phytanoyl-CoA dioxygenase family)
VRGCAHQLRFLGSIKPVGEIHVGLPADPGDVILHATSLIHGSPWSFSAALRRTICFHFNQFNDVRLQDKAYWTRASYLKDQARLQAAIELRADDPLSPSFKPAWIRAEELEDVQTAT